MLMKKAFFAIGFTLVNVGYLFSQGCSDAGFCSIGGMKNYRAGQEVNKNKLSILLANGIGDESVYVFTPAIEYEHGFYGGWAFQTKFTANYASGNLGSVVGPGDIFITGIKNLELQHNWKAAFTLGVKLPLSNSNGKKDGLSLPMQYQSSLGTVDIIGGITFSNNRWAFSAGWQQPVTGTNGNQFLPVYWGSNINAYKYQPSNDFNRKSDVLLKATYDIVQSKWLIKAGLLAIYHVGNDTYINGNISNRPIALKGSAGLTLNAIGGIWYRSKNVTLGIVAGAPFVVRDIRPDGLTRSFVASPEISFNF